MSDSTYTRKPFSPSRQLMTDVLDAASRRHMIHGLIEVDVTKPRQRIQEIGERTGESLSFTGFIIYCCARAVDMNKDVHAYRDWRNRLTIFDDVDIATAVERSAEGQKRVIFAVIRAANRKSIQEIHPMRKQHTSGEQRTPLPHDQFRSRHYRWGAGCVIHSSVQRVGRRR